MATKTEQELENARAQEVATRTEALLNHLHATKGQALRLALIHPDPKLAMATLVALEDLINGWESKR